MPTHIAVDDKLIEAACRLGHHKTKNEAVTAALTEYIAHRKRLEILDLFGTIDFDAAYDYKAARWRRGSMNHRSGSST
jgi:Arc/MetJ family transcription regulator